MRQANLTDWALELHPGDPFTPPECQTTISVSGIPDPRPNDISMSTYADPGEEPQKLVSSQVAKVIGRTVYTYTGSVYTLVGKARWEFLEWAMTKKGIIVDELGDDPLAPFRGVLFPKE